MKCTMLVLHIDWLRHVAKMLAANSMEGQAASDVIMRRDKSDGSSHAAS